MKLTLAITTYNRSDMVLEVFEKVYNYDLIDEIMIIDDHSDWEHYNNLRILLSDHVAFDKITLYRNEKNLGMSLNKKEAVRMAKNEWVILFDSDNIIYPEYLDSLYKAFDITDEQTMCGPVYWHRANPLIIYCPEKAEPDHDFTTLPNRVIDKQNAKDFLRQVEFRVFLNTSNYVVNRDEYLKVYKYNPDIQEADTIWMNTNWLKAGNAFYIVHGMRYHHRKHDGSGWINGNHAKNMRDANNLQEEIKNL